MDRKTYADLPLTCQPRSKVGWPCSPCFSNLLPLILSLCHLSPLVIWQAATDSCEGVHKGTNANIPTYRYDMYRLVHV